jgi:hypothetical protein
MQFAHKTFNQKLYVDRAKIGRQFKREINNEKDRQSRVQKIFKIII